MSSVLLSRFLSASPCPFPSRVVWSQTSSVSSLRKKFISESELKKKPSLEEIKQKKLPLNTPNLGQRIRRDRIHEFHEYERKHGYAEKDENDQTYGEILTKGIEAVQYWKNRTKKLILSQDMHRPKNGDTFMLWDFRNAGSENIPKYVTTCDSDWGEGYSTCSLELSQNGSGLFTGNINTNPPQDGRTERAGYSNIYTNIDWVHDIRGFDFEKYDGLILKVRGDGRVYSLNIHAPGDVDIFWNDIWHYPLFTRGGPYWQMAKIPFSKFYLAYKGKIQDHQIPCIKHQIEKISITLDDSIDGPFSLEIQYLGLFKIDSCMKEQFRYEEYAYPTPYFNK